MLPFTVIQSSFLLLSTFVAATQAVATPSPKSSPALVSSRKHRRHHTHRVAGHRRPRKTSCPTSAQSDSKPSSPKADSTDRSSNSTGTSSNSTGTSSNSTGASSNSTGASSNQIESHSYLVENSSETSSTQLGLVSKNLASNGVYFGFLPDDGDAGGTRTTMAQINQAIGANSAAYGWYAQAHSGTLFDGSQLLAVIDDVKACNCVFQPAVMPVGGWKGLTSSDNSQAVAIAKVMKKFTDQGIPVWLRFAHEMNYYQTDGTYNGNAADFKAGWAAVAAACKEIAPEVKMWWTPNVAAASSYQQYEPDDMSTVHLVGIDYYPKSISQGNEFVTTMKAFHDKYAVDGKSFAIGETGLGYGGSSADRISWLKQVMTSKDQLPQLISASWFNYQKDYEYRIVIPQGGGGEVTTLSKSFFKI